mmetsp:Transcript_837/g.765  ORF Transcript_837/g.765 Transcript_837/m.765 type:complete len:262 (-) Transcript_837:87-872(-)
MTLLEPFSIVKFIALGIFCVISIGFMIYKGMTTGLVTDINFLPNFESITSGIGSLCIITLSCSYQFNLMPVYKSLEDRSETTIKKSIELSTYAAVAVYIFVAISGYFSFGEGSASLLQCYNKSTLGAFLAISLQGAFFLSCLLTFPVTFFEARNSMKEIIFRLKNLNNKEVEKVPVTNMEYVIMVLIGHFTIASIGAMNLDLNGLFNLLGATVTNGFVYLFPCAFYLKMFGRNAEMSQLAKGFTIFGILMSIAGLWSTFAG